MSINDTEYGKENPFGLLTESDFHETRKNTTINIIKSLNPENNNLKILDVGCGLGQITNEIQKAFPAFTIDAIDIAGKAIELAQKNNNTIRFTVTDALDFHGFGYRYNIIVLNNIYEHIENPVRMLIHLKSLLAEEGYLIISTPNRYHIKNMMRKLLGMKIHISDYHVTEYSLGQIYDHHRYAGLNIKEVRFPAYKLEHYSTYNFIIYKLIRRLVDGYLKLVNSRSRMGRLMFIITQN